MNRNIYLLDTVSQKTFRVFTQSRSLRDRGCPKSPCLLSCWVERNISLLEDNWDSSLRSEWQLILKLFGQPRIGSCKQLLLPNGVFSGFPSSGGKHRGKFCYTPLFTHPYNPLCERMHQLRSRFHSHPPERLWTNPEMGYWTCDFLIPLLRGDIHKGWVHGFLFSYSSFVNSNSISTIFTSSYLKP